MRHFYITTLLISLFTFFIAGQGVTQILNTSEPVSFKTGMYIFDDALQNHRVPSLDLASVEAEDAERDASGLPPFDGRRIPVEWSMENNGQWFTLDNGDLLWKMKLSSPGALSLEIFFDDFYLPEGTEFSWYNEDRTQYEGAYTAYNNPESGYYATGMIEGETVVLEYYQPAEVTEKARLSIQDIGHRYRDLKSANDRSDDCQVDVNCPEGDDWQDQKRGVVRLRISVSGGGIFFCSGVLMNNTAMDCKPYILSAFHCINTSGTSAISQSDFDQLRFFFNFERPECDAGNAPAGQQVIGCTLVARSHNASGSGSDFALLELSNDVPEQYNAYWNGWSTQSSTITGGGVGIHHPSGDSKKISTSTSNYITTTWSFGGAQAYWRVFWAGTESGHGVTEGGSSGSPLYDNNKLVVGTLTGGSSYCNSVQPGGQTQPDYYGKMSYHWDQNTGSQTVHLKSKLDPVNTGQSAMLGTYAPCNTTSVEENEISFSDAISVYPNPSDGLVNISLEDRFDEVETIIVYNVIGKPIAQFAANASLISVDLSEHSRGLYLISFQMTNGSAVTQKIALR